MTKDQALQALELRKTELLSRIPEDAPAMGKRYLRYLVEEEAEMARKHLEAVYANQLELGPGLTALAAHAAHPKYAFWLEGIHRHLQRGESALEKPPPG